MKTPFATARTLEPASATTWARSGRCPPGATTRLLCHNDGPLSPGIGGNSVHLSGGGVFEELVERLTAIGHLLGAARALDGAELRGAHSGPCLRLRHALGKKHLRPDLQATGF